jgi:site-specific recombinase XerD
MTILRRRMLEDRQLRGLAPKTQQGYLAAVHQLAHHYRRAPAQRSDAALRQDLLSLLNEKKVAESTVRIHLYGIHLCGIRCFYERRRQRPWPVFELVRPHNPQKLPVVCSPQAVRSLLAVVEHPKAPMGLRIIDACGRRRREGTRRQVSDIDAQRRRVRVRQGKGGKDRCVPLAPRVLELWRAYWQRQRPHPWLFPARPRAASLSPTSRQKTGQAVVRQSGIHKAASVPTRRHAYATHRREGGVSLRVSQDLRGHKSPRTTARYPHLTPPTLGIVPATIATRMAAR